MQSDIHPAVHEVTAKCSCGNEIVISTTMSQYIHLDICSKCHPFYTGKHKVVDRGGRVESFERRYHRRKKNRTGSADN